MTPIAAMSQVLQSCKQAKCYQEGEFCVIRDGRAMLGKAKSPGRAWRDAALRSPGVSIRESYLLGLVSGSASFAALKDKLLGEVALAVVHQCNGNQVAAAELLGVHRNTIWRLLQMGKVEYGIENGHQIGPSPILAEVLSIHHSNIRGKRSSRNVYERKQA